MAVSDRKDSLDVAGVLRVHPKRAVAETRTAAEPSGGRAVARQPARRIDVVSRRLGGLCAHGTNRYRGSANISLRRPSLAGLIDAMAADSVDVLIVGAGPV